MESSVSSYEHLQDQAMKFRQWLIVAICIGILALDGYDVLSIAFAAPGLSAEWGLSKSTLGIVLSLELLGMALGSIFMGSLTDSLGRRPTMLIGLTIVTLGMLFAGLASNVYILGIARVFTGIGIGGLLATSMATSADYCNQKNRALAVVLVAGGFAFGIYAGATFLGPLLKEYDWRITFYLGAGFGLLFMPLVYFLVPETISYLERKQPKGALEKIQKTMRAMGHTQPSALPKVIIEKASPEGMANLFKKGLAPITIILILTYLGNIGTYYYFIKWIPKIITEVGFTASQASQVLGVISLGGVVGSISMGLIAKIVNIRFLMIASLLMAGTGVAIFPNYMDSIESMKAIGFLIGLFIFAGVCGFAGLWAATFPSSLLGSGSGLVLGCGRAGAVLGPIIPGFLFAAGLDLAYVAIIMAVGSIAAGIILIFLKPKRESVSF